MQLFHFDYQILLNIDPKDLKSYLGRKSGLNAAKFASIGGKGTQRQLLCLCNYQREERGTLISVASNSWGLCDYFASVTRNSHLHAIKIIDFSKIPHSRR